jgi:acyl-CoA hydrolase
MQSSRALARSHSIAAMAEAPRSGEPRASADSASILVKWMGITDANSAGFVHGGMVMKLCDEAAALAAMRHCGRRVVTAGMDRMTFVEPISIANLVTCRSQVNAVWRTSMEVGVRVEAENMRTGEVKHTSTAYLTMVCLDDDGKPAPVPPLVIEGEDELRRQREAELRRANRLAERDQIKSERSS